MPYSAALLAGGKSSRMGRDKATIPVDGLPLWRRQLALLAQTEAADILISGSASGPWLGEQVKIVPDLRAGEGPLGALGSLLHRCETEWLLVLAVDMPAMSAAYLRGLAEEAQRTRRAVVPRFPELGWEPLAAVYPTAAVGWIDRLLASGVRKMEAFIRLLEEHDLLSVRLVPESERALFANWNEPGDLPGGVS